MSTRRVVAKNTAMQVVGKIITAFSTLAVTMLVTRRFGPEGFGQFMIMTTFPALFWIMVQFGFNEIVVREIKKREEKTQVLFSNLLVLRLILAVFFTAVALFTLFAVLPYDADVKLGATLNLVTLFVMSFYSTAQVLFQAKLAYNLQLISQVIGSLGGLAFSIAMIFLGKPVLWVALGSLIGYSTMAFSASLLVSRFVSFKKLEWCPARAKKLFKMALPVGLALIFNIFDFKIDSLMLSALPLKTTVSNNSAVGFYSSAFKIFEVILTLPFFFMNSVYPFMVEKVNEGEKLFPVLGKSVSFLLAVSILGVVVGIPLAPHLIYFVAGSGFGASVKVLRTLLYSLPVFFLTSLLSRTVLVLEKQKVLPWIYGAATVLNIVLNMIYIPRYTYTAAAVITGVTEVFVLVLLVVALRKSLLVSCSSEL
ncbi:MAG: flippase [Patescibacteria group bacterium]|nr:flippase [Patescibacteria group bacterium]